MNDKILEEVKKDPVPQITQLKIRNFGCIGDNEVSIDIDRIVVLVGENNAGKSTILRAFEVVTDNQKLSIDDFYNKNRDIKPEITLISTVIQENKPGDEWCKDNGDGTWTVQEKWTWEQPDSIPTKIGFLAKGKRWATKEDKEKGPWGAAAVAKSKRPKPHRVSTFDSPETQSQAIISLLNTALESELSKLDSKDNITEDAVSYKATKAKLLEYKSIIKKTQDTQISEIQKKANDIMESIFPNHNLVIKDVESPDMTLKLFSNEFEIEMGMGNNTFPLSKQGSGTQRTALWAILKILADNGYKAKLGKNVSCESVGKNISHVLLIDEPEVSLHPKAIGNVRDVLYKLADGDNWQVMITTHSPHFIDLAKDHTTIIRVEKKHDGVMHASTLFRPEEAKLSTDDKENLKLTNLFDSHISEAFFGGRVIIVEGDTEYTAFNFIKSNEKENGNKEYDDINIIRARGKVTVASMMKVLNHFKRKYYVLHDSDSVMVQSKRREPKSIDGKVTYKVITIKNPAWTNNEKILDNFSEYSRVVASIKNFEEAYFMESISSGKPDNCMEHIKNKKDKSHYDKIKKLLDFILTEKGNIENAIAWSKLEELESAYNNWDKNNIIVI
ncbi:TPA: ATP-dependent endonuclease [Yersinia enterocolitica]|nr:AAA family ATPase [Yersinia enterocolitica]EKN5063249.1 ATP-dependent endonuclease [Yersinia enterocolitica]HEN3542018.1 AAA family ATPase [Yersinia enterocolitica]